MPKSRHGGLSDDPFYDQELPGLDGLNAVSATCKHEADVYRHIEEKGLGPCDKTIYLLQRGSDTQRATALAHFHVSLAACTVPEVKRIIAELQESMWQLEVAVQITAAQALVQTLPSLEPEATIDIIDLAETMLQLKDDRIQDVWCDVYVALLKSLPLSVMEDRLVEVTLKKGQLSEPLYDRTLCCRLIGGFCERYPDDAKFISQFIDQAVALCQDTDLTVRSTMCATLNRLARTVGLAVTKEVVMRELHDLLNDEEDEVAKTAFCTLMDLMDFLDPQYRTAHAYPVVKSYVRNPPPAVHSTLVENFGKYIWAVKQVIHEQGEEDAVLFVRFFAGIGQDPDPAVRRWCVYNMPAVCAAVPTPVFSLHVLPVLKTLSEDDSVETRRTVAAGLHEICKIYGHKSYSQFRHIVAALIQDPDLKVVDYLMVNISTVFGSFLSALPGEEEKDRFFSQVLPHIVRYWERSVTSVARIETLNAHLLSFPQYFTAGQLQGTFIPLLLKQLSNGPRALTSQCAKITVVFCRKLQSSGLEAEIFNRLIAEFAKSKSYWNRLAFIEVCVHTLDHYSRKFFRERLLDHVLELGKDSVSSVRRRLCIMLPALKRALRPPADVEHLATLIQVVSRLQMDGDRDVLEAIQVAGGEIDAIEKEMRTADYERDLVDSERESEEQQLREAAMEQDKLERRQKIREMLYNDKQEKNAQADKKGAGKRSSGDRLPPAPSGSAVRQPLGGVVASSTRLNTSSPSASVKAKRLSTNVGRVSSVLKR